MRPARLQGALAALGIALASGTAAADVSMKWDCYLPNTGVDCVMLRSSLTSKIPFLRTVSDPRAADVVVTVRSLPAENGARFKLDFEGRRVDGFATEVHTSDKIPNGIDATTRMVRLLTKLERGLDDFMDQKKVAEVSGGKLDIVVTDPVSVPFTGRPEQSSVKWFVSPSAGAYFSDVDGVGVNASGSVSLSFNYSEDRWRLQQWGGASYSRQSQPVPSTGETASISFVGGNANNVISRDLTRDHRWSAGLLLGAEKNPQANYRMRANGSVGVELDLVPRQTENVKNLGFHCAIGPELEHYDAPNIEGLAQQLVARQFCDVFFSWHFAPVDLWASVSETTVLKDVDYRAFSAGLSATWRLTENLTVSPWVNVQNINKAINQAAPGSVTYADPKAEIEASMRAAVEQGYTAPFGVQSGLSVAYLFGNGSLSSEDMRWRGASSLR